MSAHTGGTLDQAQRTSAARMGLEIRQLSVAYGGRVAAANVSLAADLGQITGLIGPNGAGKTTIFNTCSGLLRPTRGSVHLFGEDVTGKRPAARARKGLGRTFQRVEVVNAMDVRTNVMLGLEARSVGGNPVRQIFSSVGERRILHRAVDEALAICGISEIADRKVATLSTGQRRLVELARVLAGGFKVLLLDEPSSGLDESETEEFGSILVGIVEDGTRGILLVEHDMALVMSVCDQIYVLEFGHLVFEGTPPEVRASPIVQSAYLGEESSVTAGSPS